MPYPSVRDDGQTVTLDLHGATVDEARAVTIRLVHEAARRGRRSVNIVHGHSTSRERAIDRTIKHAVYDLLDQGLLDDIVGQSWRAEGHLLLALDLTVEVDPTPIRLSDVL